MTLVPKLSPRAHPCDVASRAAHLVRRRGGRAPRSSGPLDASETGEGRVSRRDPHCAPTSIQSRPALCSGRLLVRESRWHPCRLLRSPARRFAFRESDARARRPPRPFPRGSREGRTLLRSEIPSTVRRLQLLPYRSTSGLRALFEDVGVHVIQDRPSSDEPFSLRPVRPGRLRARGAPLLARPPSTRLLPRSGFRPVRCRGRVSLSLRTA